MNSSRPYLIRALYEWIVDNQMTPNILVDAGMAGVEVPQEHVDDGKISYKIGKDNVFPDFMKHGTAPSEIVGAKGLSQISDEGALTGIIADAIGKNPKSVSDFKTGKKNALMFLVGQVMRASKGKANPNLVKELLEKELGG